MSCSHLPCCFARGVKSRRRSSHDMAVTCNPLPHQGNREVSDQTRQDYQIGWLGKWDRIKTQRVAHNFGAGAGGRAGSQSLQSGPKWQKSASG